MEIISVFDMFKIGIGPSSSHTLGPWRAAQAFGQDLVDKKMLSHCGRLQLHLYGSLALTGIGHGTDIALLLGLSGRDARTVDLDEVSSIPQKVQTDHRIRVANKRMVPFRIDSDLIFHYGEQLPFHANGMKFQAFTGRGELLMEDIYYSTGGGFIVREGETEDKSRSTPPFPILQAADLQQYGISENASIWEIVMENERTWYTEKEIEDQLQLIWKCMQSSVYRGCHRSGELPGGLHVKRRAAGIHQHLMRSGKIYYDQDEWLEAIREDNYSFPAILKWIGCFAMAVNEENANFGRIVTSPTNGSAGVIPAVIMYYLCFTDQRPSFDDIARFLLTAGVIGSIFKNGATISAAMGGCQAEIGVSSAMAAAGLTEVMGGSIGQILMAAEIAMEHHLGLTCDPIGGLVQVPCIERNSMGAVKAITAAEIALESDPESAKVSLDKVVRTMWETAQDMHAKYKETSKGGLATNVPINLPEC